MSGGCLCVGVGGGGGGGGGDERGRSAVMTISNY